MFQHVEYFYLCVTFCKDHIISDWMTPFSAHPPAEHQRSALSWRVWENRVNKVWDVICMGVLFHYGFNLFWVLVGLASLWRIRLVVVSTKDTLQTQCLFPGLLISLFPTCEYILECRVQIQTHTCTASLSESPLWLWRWTLPQEHHTREDLLVNGSLFDPEPPSAPKSVNVTYKWCVNEKRDVFQLMIAFSLWQALWSFILRRQSHAGGSVRLYLTLSVILWEPWISLPHFVEINQSSPLFFRPFPKN